ncbi:hypothetical protein EDB38_1375, partial [Vibrio crassostreae]
MSRLLLDDAVLKLIDAKLMLNGHVTALLNRSDNTQ